MQAAMNLEVCPPPRETCLHRSGKIEIPNIVLPSHPELMLWDTVILSDRVKESTNYAPEWLTGQGKRKLPNKIKAIIVIIMYIMTNGM